MQLKKKFTGVTTLPLSWRLPWPDIHPALLSFGLYLQHLTSTKHLCAAFIAVIADHSDGLPLCWLVMSHFLSQFVTQLKKYTVLS